MTSPQPQPQQKRNRFGLTRGQNMNREVAHDFFLAGLLLTGMFIIIGLLLMQKPWMQELTGNMWFYLIGGGLGFTILWKLNKNFYGKWNYIRHMHATPFKTEYLEKDWEYR